MPSEFRILEADGESDFALIEAAGDAEDKQLRRFRMTAYTGGKLDLPNFPYPVVADLSGMRIPAKSRPILRDHRIGQIVGHTQTIEINGSSIRLVGVISATNEHAREVAESSDNGFPWQASIGAVSTKVVFVDRGETVEVNGRKFTGPLYVARKSSLREVSFVALGADDQTSATLAAGQSTTTHIGVTDMEFDDWLQAQGFSSDELNEAQTTAMQALFDASQAKPDDEQDKTGDRSASPPVPAQPVQAAADFTSPQPSLDPVDDMRARWATERRRIAAISDICGGAFPDIEAKAVEEGWDETKTELAVLRAGRPQAPAVHSSDPDLNTETLEAAACLAAELPEDALVKAYGERTMEAAYPMRSIGLRELIAECARLEGVHVPRVFGDGKETMRAGFSTVSLPGILENVMNKTLLDAYQTTPIVALQLCAIATVTDFKEVSRYRLLGTGGFEKVAPDGELKSGTLSEQKFRNKAETYGQILMLTREDIFNDSLNAFLDITRQMGRSGAELVDDLFFSLLLSNPNGFFSEASKNYLTGADTAFDTTSMTKAKTLFRKQKAGPGNRAKDQKPVNIRPEILLVPVELETEADLMISSAQLMMDAQGAPTKIPTDNPHRNKYKVVSAPHMSDPYYTGASGKAWYLLANPKVLAAFEVVYLNGRRTPIIERVEAPPNQLGMGFRAYIDVGLSVQERRAAVKVKGE